VADRLATGGAARQVGALFDAGVTAGLTDGQLLDRFEARGGRGPAAELAFEAIVRRHGPAVLRLCRRSLADPNDAQDAFQATFLVLVRRAGAVRRRESLGSWLQGVALRVAAASRTASARRRRHERRRAESAPDARDDPPRDDLGPLLHEELARLPEPFRAALTLCDLDGLTHEQAALRLGLPVGTVKSRLARGRARLRDRLTGRGLAPTIDPLVVPPSLSLATVRAAARLAADPATLTVGLPAPVLALTQGVLRMMLVTQWKTAAATAVGVLALAAGTGVLARPSIGPGGVADAETAAAVTAAPPAKAVDSTPGPDGGKDLPREFALVAAPEYVVRPPDLIVVRVLVALPGRPIEGDRLVRPDGRITLGFYGEVYVAGLTTREIKEKVVLHLREYLSDDQLGLTRVDSKTGAAMRVEPGKSAKVSVDVAAYNSQYYYVQGGVAVPGRLPITGGETVLDAITFAGGVTPSDVPSRVRLVRPAPPGGVELILPVDLAAVVNAGDPTTNYQIKAGDRLVVDHPRPAPSSVPIPETTNVKVRPAGDPPTPMHLEPPTEDEVWDKIPKSPRAGRETFSKVERHNARFLIEKVEQRAEPCKVYPLAGPCRLVTARYKCTVDFDEVSRPDAPTPPEHTDHRQEVVMIEKAALSRCPSPEHPHAASPAARAIPAPEAATADATASRLSEVERKLDLILNRLDKPGPDRP